MPPPFTCCRICAWRRCVRWPRVQTAKTSLIGLPPSTPRLAEHEFHELLKRLIDQDSLREEVEVVMARFGRTELLEARMAALRSRYEQPATGQVVANSRSAADVETQARNSIAYLSLCAGDAASAEREWQAAIDQVQIRMNASTGRARGVVSGPTTARSL